ncbi:transmembrane protein [Ceratobasidium sp. AG-Ba]|nr:transmembrane protein [Ceratobasidium sp. AG-Ba]
MVSVRQLVWAALACATHAVSQSTSFIRVDDSQAFSNTNRYGIQYGPGWTPDDAMGARYHGTYTSTNTPGSFMTFLFRGTGITYVADRGPDSATVLLAIDGDLYMPLVINTTTMSHQQAVFAVSGLEPGDHQIVIGSQPAYVNQPGVVGLDYFGVTPIDDNSSYVPQYHGPGAWSVPVNAIIVDNEDPSIVYSDASWRLFDHPTTRPSPLYFNGTQRSSQKPGSSLTFTFEGTSVYYFSDDFWDNANVSVSIDGGEADIIDTSTGATWISQKMFWSKAGLADGKHVVTVTHVGKQGSFANVDFFMYVPSSPSSASGSSVQIAPIIGGVLGGVAGLGLILLGLLFLHKKRHAAKEKAKPEPTKAAEAGVHHITLSKTASRDSDLTLDEKVGDEKAIA